MHIYIHYPTTQWSKYCDKDLSANKMVLFSVSLWKSQSLNYNNNKIIKLFLLLKWNLRTTQASYLYWFYVPGESCYLKCFIEFFFLLKTNTSYTVLRLLSTDLFFITKLERYFCIILLITCKRNIKWKHAYYILRLKVLVLFLPTCCTVVNNSYVKSHGSILVSQTRFVCDMVR